MNTSDFIFYADSDIHFQLRNKNGTPDPNAIDVNMRPEKSDNVDIIINDKESEFVIIAGDLTQNGSDGKKIGCLPISGPEKQLQGLQQKYIDICEKNNKKVYLCMGNHDEWTYPPYIYKAIEKYIKTKHGNLLYTFEHKGVQFINLGKYPNRSACNYFKSVAQKNKPTVLVCHFNFIGPYSDWWTNDEKKYFEKTIDGYNIILIICGHIHANNRYVWAHRYDIVTCGGMGITKCKYNSKTNTIETNVITNINN